MRKEKRILRSVGGMSYWFYKKADFARQCKDLKQINFEQVKKPSIGKRKNTHIMEFLRTLTSVPTRWEMTLC